MVYPFSVALLIDLTWKIAYMFESSRKVTEHNARVPVKAPNYLLQNLNLCIPITESLSKTFKEAEVILRSMQSWKRKFENNYVEVYFQNKPANLLESDAKKLEKDCISWHETIVSLYNKPSTVMLNQFQLSAEVEHLGQLIDDPDTKMDLLDALHCIGNMASTPAVMILHRVGESMVRKLYKKVLQIPPPLGASWGQMVRDIKPILDKENDPIVGLLDFRRFNRNQAQHPGERYDQKDAEKIFVRTQELIEEIHKRLSG